jgi:hypothetical protein
MEAGTHYPADSADATQAARDARRRERAHAQGWINFAAAYLLVAGGITVIWGIVALANKSAFAEDGLVWSKLNTWGWIAIGAGVLQMVAALLVMARQFSGQWLAGVMAIGGIFVHLLAVGAYPVWSVIAIVANGLVLWAVTAHGDEFD